MVTCPFCSIPGASAASKAYLEALSRLSSCATESASHGASDIGETLNDIVQTYSEIRNHELTLLKAFYVDLVAPMETNIEKDWRVVQAEHKRFTAHWRTLQDSFGRAQVGVKKSQKKLKNSKSSTMLDKEIKQIQRFDEEKIKCEMFLEKSLKDVMTQERRRYGFVLERQCSLAKHFHALHRTGESCLGPKLEQWNQVAQTREKLRSDVDNYFGVESSQFESASSKDSSAMLKRNRSVDSSVLTSPDQCRLMRTRSNYELHSSTSSLHMMSDPVEPEVPSAGPVRPAWDTDSSDSASAGSHSADRPLVRAIYAYLSSGEHQLSFHQGDVIACIGERNKGWQFGENVRTRRCGWFPAAYTEPVTDSASSQGSESSAEASASGSRPRSLTVRPEEAPLSLSTFRPSPPGALPTPSRRPTSVHAELTSRLAARKSMTNVIGDDPEPVSLPVDIHACAARRRRAVDVARRRTVGALVSERPSALAVSTARKHDTVSIFQTDAEYEELRYDAAPAPAPAPVSSGAGRRRCGSSELRRHHSVAAPSVSEKLRQFNIDLFNYGSYLSRRLYLPEKDSKLEETEEGQRCGPWYDLWAADSSCRKQVHGGGGTGGG
ncbi:Brain-specific angiogenesis inhibitor 1-associated protein 2-like protein 1 [Amphibalanus amphitrite]|uniref:Brain-specific angiogenesis inhibitor 1-associated protein 2-like protein 1 n=1 Tax=Amphibalanus amphitrite TaxID=1232801 RepID=A0A6A4WBU1_AMPAM|nr:Brain-specific angiogenesis inhibitor 1-associated protein 2-like protein 1 [Amphibalanus amphitrite]